MVYNQFTITKVKHTFGILTQENIQFFPDIPPAEPAKYLQEFLKESIPLAVATGSEKARSELIISPIILEVRRLLGRQISLFSGEEFTVDLDAGLNGRCDFLISNSVEQLEIESPVVVIVEAKRADLNTGMGQCMAEMVAAQRFNELNGTKKIIYGSVTSGTQWRFMRLIDNIVQIDFTEYAVPPVDQIIGFLLWMIENLD
ncbi:MAG: hypothetical protein ACYTXA_26765 [Nostoc sp.]